MEQDYEQTITSLKKEINKFWEEQRRLQAQVASVTAENERLSEQLPQLSAAAADVSPAADHDQLQQRLQTAVKERESAVQLWRQSVGDVQRLEARLAEATGGAAQQRWIAHIQQVRAQYARALSSLSGELSRQRAAAEQAAAELAAAEEARQTADDSCRQQRQLSARLTEQLQAAGEQLQRQQVTQQQQQQLQEAAAAHQQQLETAAGQRRQLEQQLLEARQRCAALSEREAEALRKLQEGVDVVQTSLLEKREAEQRAAALQGHVAELEAAVSRLAEEAGLSTRQQVDAVRRESNRRLAEMAAQLQRQQSEEVEHQEAVERLQRQNKQLELEFDRLKERQCGGGAAAGAPDALDELTGRLARAEDARLTAEQAAADARRQLSTETQRHALQLQSCEESLAEQQRRVAEITENCDQLRHQKRALSEALAAAQLQHGTDLDEACEKRQSLEKAVSLLELKLQQQAALLSRQLESHETDHEHTKLELRQHVADQQNVAAKWRRELLSEAGQHRQQLHRLHCAQQQLQQQLAALQQQLRDSRQRETDAAEAARRLRARNRELELRIQAAEKRFLTLHSGGGGGGAARGRLIAAAAGGRDHLED